MPPVGARYLEAVIMTTLRVRQRHIRIAAILVFLTGGGMCAAQDTTVAIVEDTSGKVAGVEPLDLLRLGREIELSADSGLIISYLNSCQRENIRGGKVVIGDVQSEVTGGEVSRRRVPCDAAALNLTPEQANQSATLVFRGDDSVEGDPVAAEAKFLLDTRQPIVLAPGIAEITVENRRNPSIKWSVKLVDGVADITRGHGLLDQGGVYRIVSGQRSVIFRVGKEASDAPMPILKRLVRLRN